MKSRLVEFWLKAAKDLGLSIEAPYRVEVETGNYIDVLVFVKNIGARKGMLILDDYNAIKSSINLLNNLGYGYSIMNEPLPSEKYSKEEYLEIIEDWQGN